MSIRNISTNKKATHKKFLGVKKGTLKNADQRYEKLNEVSKKLTISGLSGKINQKELDSHRGQHVNLMIDELDEPEEQSLKDNQEVLSSGKISDDEELNYLTESRDSYRHKILQKVQHNRSFTNNHHTNYQRITHASKLHNAQNLPKPPSRMGQTMMGFHREGLAKASPLLQSMPNLNIKNIRERNDDDQSQKSHHNISVFQTYTQNPVIE